MKTTDVRIGNVVFFEDMPCMVREIHGDSFTLETHPYPGEIILKADSELVQPIVLTAHMLIFWFGFETLHMESAIRFWRGKIELYKEYNKNEFHWISETHSKVIKYVHEIQNVYYIIEETELTIK